MAVGAQVDIIDIPGYMPRINNEQMNELFAANLVELVGAENVGYAAHGTGSSDYGDVQHLVPGIHPYVGGAVGVEHGSSYAIENPELFYIVAAKAMAMTTIDLLANGAEKALEIKKCKQGRIPGCMGRADEIRRKFERN